MGFNKLIKGLQKVLANKGSSNVASRERLDSLLDKLEKKEKKLKQKLDKEKNPKKRKELKLQLKIATAQRKKGVAYRRKL
jgi:hypothetical protein